jgi:hypothetical protein
VATDDPYPDLNLDELIGLTAEDAVATAKAHGVERIRLIDFINGAMVGAIDLMLARRRLDLSHQDGLVVRAVLPSVRSAGAGPRRADTQE